MSDELFKAANWPRFWRLAQIGIVSPLVFGLGVWLMGDPLWTHALAAYALGVWVVIVTLTLFPR